MIAMQYRFVLPADYDMAAIRERIATKGPLLDNLPGLIFKAYLHAEDPEHTYAPFYLWRDEEAMHGFLNGPAFAGVSQAFGWPSVKTWTPWHATVTADVRQAQRATISSAAIAPYSALAQLREQEQAAAQQALAHGALAVVVAFEPVTWTMTRLNLWRSAAAAEAAHAGQTATVRHYQVGHVSAPGVTAM